MTNELIVRPRLTVLTDAQAEHVHSRSLKLLSTVGIRVDSDRARRVFARALGQSSRDRTTDNRQLHIPPELIDWALSVAPSSVDIYDRRGSRAFALGQDRTRFGIGVTTLNYQDPETDQVVPFSRLHMQTAVRLGSVLSSFDVISTVGIPTDVTATQSDLYAALDMTANTLKPLVLLVSDEKRFPDVLDLLEHLHGDLASQPFAIPYLNPISPLVLNAGTVDKMWSAIERGLPVIFSNYGMAGASTPIAPEGTLVLLNAELLAGLALAQLIRQGTPVILGSLPAFLDMRTMASFYDTTSYLLNLACAEMMARYRLPHCGTSGSGIGWGPDLVAGGHQWINHLLSCIGKVGLAPFVGDTLGSKAFSPALLVYANEVIAQARRFVEGFNLEAKETAIQEVAAVGPGGSFLTTENTLAGYRGATYQSGFFENLSLEAWQARGSPRAIDRLRQYTRHLLQALDAPDDHDDLLGRGQAYIQALTAGRP